MTRRGLVRLAITAALLLAAAAMPVRGAEPGCHAIPRTPNTPTGIAGCGRYGTGIASMWGGPGAARNDCVWPWTGCQTIAVRSLDTGLVIVVTPTMFGDLYTGTAQERIVDLDPAMVAALGLDASAGLWPVSVEPVSGTTGLPTLPDTAYAGRP